MAATRPLNRCLHVATSSTVKLEAASHALSSELSELSTIWSRVSSTSSSCTSLVDAQQLQHTLKAHAVAVSAIYKAQQDLQAALDEQIAAASLLAGKLMIAQARLQNEAKRQELPGVPTLNIPRPEQEKRDLWRLLSSKQHASEKDMQLGMGMRH